MGWRGGAAVRAEHAEGTERPQEEEEEGREEEGEERVPWRGSRCLPQGEGGEGRAVLRHIGERGVGELTAAPVR